MSRRWGCLIPIASSIIGRNGFAVHCAGEENGKPPSKKARKSLYDSGQNAIKFSSEAWPGLDAYFQRKMKRFDWVVLHKNGGSSQAACQSTDKVQDAFIKTKTWIATVTMLAYPDHNKSFHIYTDASDYQLGAIIMQEGRPAA